MTTAWDVYITVWDPIRSKFALYEEPATNLSMTEREADVLLAELVIDPDYRGMGQALLSARKTPVGAGL
jgi:hypothetical protein